MFSSEINYIFAVVLNTITYDTNIIHTYRNHHPILPHKL